MEFRLQQKPVPLNSRPIRLNASVPSRSSDWPFWLVGLPLGEHAPARSSLDDVRSMVRRTAVEKIVKPVPPSNVREIVIDPECPDRV
jgi:hypothetical protein